MRYLSTYAIRMYIASIGIARTSIAPDDTASESSLKTAGVTLIFITCESLPLAPCLLLVELICEKSFLRAETYDGGIQDTHRSFRAAQACGHIPGPIVYSKDR